MYYLPAYSQCLGIQAIKVSLWVVYDEEKELGQIEIFPLVNKLGSEGWELVSVVPRSSLVDFSNRSLAGITSEELWVFKRSQAA